MSQENVEIAAQSNALFNAGKVDAAFDLCHPDIAFRDLQHAPDVPEAVQGADALRVVLMHWSDNFAELRVDAVDYIDAGPWVIADVRWRGKGKGSEIVIDAHQADALRIKEGKIVEWIVGYPDVETALADLGLKG
jgi:ketosteroid isomerase-like protein